MKKNIDLKVKKPRLAYVGMDKKTAVEAVPTQVVEVVYPSRIGSKQKATLFSKGQLLEKVTKTEDLPKNRLIWTNDNLVALKTLLDEKDPISGSYRYRNKIDLIYIDPPFMIQDDFVAQNSIDVDIDKEEDVVSVKEPTIIETIAYKDTWENGLDSFLQMMRDRLKLMKELLAPTGSIYVHLDWHATHYIKVLMDEIFGYENFVREIIWSRGNPSGGKASAQNYIHTHDDILFYAKINAEKYFYKQYEEYDQEYIEKRFIHKDKKGRYRLQGSDNRKQYLIESKGKALTSVWDLADINVMALEKTGYPTQKPQELLRRIIKTSCPNGGVVLDAFMGSGTTCEVAEKLAEELNCNWIGIDNSKFAVHTARKRLIELSTRLKENKKEGLYKVRPFTVENMGYYQRGAKWDTIQIGKNADAYRQAIVELFGGEYSPYSKLLHGKKRGSWIHVGPLSSPLVGEQVLEIAKDVENTQFKKCYVLSADFTAHLNKVVEKAKKEYGVQIIVRIIPVSAIEEVKKRLDLIKGGVKDSKKVEDMPNLAFFAPLVIKINKIVDGKELMIELQGIEVDAESFLESQKPEQQARLKKWLKKEKSWRSFVDFWAIDWDYQSLKDNLKESIFENEWQSFKKRKGKKIVEDLVFKAFHTYDSPGEYTVAVKVTDVFGNDGIVTTKIVVKK